MARSAVAGVSGSPRPISCRRPNFPRRFVGGSAGRQDGRNDRPGASAPRIIDFTGIEEGPNQWTFEGRVVGDNISSLVVQLGGIPSLAGQTATTDSNGWFQITVQLNPREHGTATAQTTDQWGQSSNTARTPVDPALYSHENNQRSH